MMGNDYDRDEDYWDDIYFREQSEKGAYGGGGIRRSGSGHAGFWVSVALVILAAQISVTLGEIVLFLCITVAFLNWLINKK